MATSSYLVQFMYPLSTLYSSCTLKWPALLMATSSYLVQFMCLLHGQGGVDRGLFIAVAVHLRYQQTSEVPGRVRYDVLF